MKLDAFPREQFFGERGRLPVLRSFGEGGDCIRRRLADGIFPPKPVHLPGDSALRMLLSALCFQANQPLMSQPWHSATRQNKTLPGWEARPNVKAEFARAHGMWTDEPREGRNAATAVCSASAVVTLASSSLRIADCGLKGRQKWPCACVAFNPQSEIRNLKSNRCLIKS